jgi:hypothetical protein
MAFEAFFRKPQQQPFVRGCGQKHNAATSIAPRLTNGDTAHEVSRSDGGAGIGTDDQRRETRRSLTRV